MTRYKVAHKGKSLSGISRTIGCQEKESSRKETNLRGFLVSPRYEKVIIVIHNGERDGSLFYVRFSKHFAFISLTLPHC